MYLHGFHAIRERLGAGAGTTLLLAQHSGSRHRELRELAAAHQVPVREVPERELSALAGDTRHRGALLEVPGRPRAQPAPAPKQLQAALAPLGAPSLVVVLDGVTDPMNAGSILRSSEQFGVGLVVVRDRRQAPLDTPTVARASAGANALTATVTVVNIPRALATLKEAGYWIYAAALTGTPVDAVEFPSRVALVLGAEGKGLSPAMLKACDQIVTIPTVGRLDSLNVAVAAGICLYAIRASWKAGS